MRTLLVTPLLFVALSVSAADSAVLKEIMGESVYERSGIGELSEDQIRVLENWILNNAVEKHIVSKPEKSKKQVQPAKPAQDTTEPPSRQESKSQVAEEVTPEAEEAPRYVRLAEPEEQQASPEEEPVTQKYVLVDTLDEWDRERVEPDLIRSRIDGKFKGWRNNKTRFRLENGEVWEQRQSSTYITDMDSPEVVIRKSRFGYTMEVPAVGRKVHVKRIK